jgi:type I restriction enzyme S subunit
VKAGWTTKTLADVCTVFADGDWIESKDQSTDGIRLIQTGNVGEGEFKDRSDKARYISEETFARLRCTEIFEGDCLISRLPDPVGRSAILPDTGERMITAVDCTIVRFDQTLCLPTFFNYYSQSTEYINNIAERCTGTTRNRISRSQLGNTTLPIPSIKEQHRIVILLDEAFADIATAKANAEKNLHSARDLFSSHLQSIFTTRGEDWVEKPLGDIGKVSMCKRIFKEQTSPAGDIPFYKIGTFGKQADAFIPAEIYRQFRQKFPFPSKGAVLVSAAGTVGRRVVYDGEDAYFQDSNIVWIANDQTKVLNHFLYHFYGSCDWNSTQGATISRLYNDNLRQIVIAFPQSLDEQNRIATQLDVMTDETNRLTALYRQKLTALDDLKKSLLHQAFSGQL